jgi:cytidylate kinase
VPRSRPLVAIDGPAGAGKSTIARRVAKELGFLLVDTGAIYRTVALAAKQSGVAWDDGPGVTALAEALVAAHAIELYPMASGAMGVKLHGEDVNEAIRTPDMSLGASTVSAHPGVRNVLLTMQRKAGVDGGVVLEGRDIGTVVFPDAEVKLFLTAKAEVRAKRRFDELVAKGQTVSFEETLADVKKRDEKDQGRAIAPLRQAADAILVDSSDMTIDEVVASMLKSVRERSK